MEIERGIKIEYGDDWEAGLSSGPRSMDQLPDYTNEELQQGLGDVSAEIERVFRPARYEDSSDPEIVTSGTA